MATGYTYPVVEGELTTLRDFIVRCANALVYDRSCESGLPEPAKPDLSYYEEQLPQARADLDKYRSMSLAIVKKEMLEENDRDAKRVEECRESALVKVKRVDAMLAKVSDWIPPTPKHEDLKNFMMQQLTETREWEAHGLGVGAKAEEEEVRLLKQKPAEWLQNKIVEAERYVARYTEAIEQECRRTDERNAFFAALRKNLPNY